MLVGVLRINKCQILYTLLNISVPDAYYDVVREVKLKYIE